VEIFTIIQQSQISPDDLWKLPMLKTMETVTELSSSKKEKGRRKKGRKGGKKEGRKRGRVGGRVEGREEARKEGWFSYKCRMKSNFMLSVYLFIK
jgi:hypothetical protein